MSSVGEVVQGGGVCTKSRKWTDGSLYLLLLGTLIPYLVLTSLVLPLEPYFIRAVFSQDVSYMC